MKLVAHDLACRRAGRTIFRGLGFAVAPGAAAALRGPNGSGKSSLLRVLAGLAPAAGGTVRLGDLDLARDGEAWRERVALAGHLDAVKPGFSVRENLTCWADFHGAPRARADAALERFGLESRADDPAHWCSAGQKRRLGLARLLIVDRPVWLLDEPTVSLDAASVAVFAQVVAEHCAAGGLALAATHVDLGFGAGAEVHMPAPGASDPADDDANHAASDPFLGEDWA
ncbi:heme exporter protein A [Albimonas donghaensis]|uniref:Heme exporter protein A n=1 Tax=Albimonas donghaensis TaxID=356660 RepID=A0A1H2WWD0_9RHOB|nr:heme ABC exporter ATP-binding protein CcmA [Albimonas donghaensis]SDW84912.1 heme exporter protein A [Albimonas donghaensis]